MAEPPHWIEWVSRLGFRAKGIVYVVVGTLAMQTAVKAGGRTSDPQQALAAISHRPFGMFLLGMIAFGLPGFVAWCLLQVIWDPERRARGWRGLVRRAAFAGVALTYGSLAYAAVKLLAGARQLSRGMQPSDWTRLLLAEPAGRWLVAAVGLGIVAFGFFQVYQGAGGSFVKALDLTQMKAPEQRAARILGGLGLAARGLTFLVIGGFFIRAAYDARPREARGLGGALAQMAQQRHGQLMLGTVAIGFVVYGAYMFVEARFRRFGPPA